MKPVLTLLSSCWLALLLGCGHVDLTPEGDPNRVVAGTVNVRMNLIPPPDAELIVRLVDPPDVTTAPTAVSRDLVIGERGTRENPESIVAQQVLRGPSAVPVAFRLEFRADDAQLRRGLNLEARLWWGGKLRFRNVESQVVTLETVGEAQTIWIEPVL